MVKNRLILSFFSLLRSSHFIGPLSRCFIIKQLSSIFRYVTQIEFEWFILIHKFTLTPIHSNWKIRTYKLISSIALILTIQQQRLPPKVKPQTFEHDDSRIHVWIHSDDEMMNEWRWTYWNVFVSAIYVRAVIRDVAFACEPFQRLREEHPYSNKWVDNTMMTWMKRIIIIIIIKKKSNTFENIHTFGEHGCFYSLCKRWTRPPYVIDT